jgi:hypothetical protein
MEQLVGPYKPWKVLKAWILQENDHNEKRLNGIQVTIVRSWITED